MNIKPPPQQTCRVPAEKCSPAMSAEIGGKSGGKDLSTYKFDTSTYINLDATLRRDSHTGKLVFSEEKICGKKVG